MNTTFDKNWLIRTFTEKLAMGDTNPIVMECVRHSNRMVVITPIFRDGFLIDVVETDMTFPKVRKPIPFPKSIQDMKNLFHRGKEGLEDFFYDIGLLGESQVVYVGKDKRGHEIWETVDTDTWKRVI